MLAVETAVRAYARKFRADEETWAVAGLVHDLDYERHPDLETGHPRMAIEELRRREYPEEVIHAVQSHAEFLGVPRESLLDKTLFACDELSGFIAACAYVRPEGIEGMKPKSVKKKLKQPSFAAGVNRDDVYTGAAELEPESGMDLDAHLQFVIDALAERADDLGLRGQGAARQD
jgi:putative nucleotidyltransferase with HDIG domain